MPLDSTGTYRHNDQSARLHSAKPEKPLAPKGTPEEKPEPEEHDAIHEHLKQRHAETGNAHSHIEHHADGSHTSHHIDESGEVSGPHDHENLEALKQHMDQFANEEEGEQGEGQEEPAHMSALGV